MNNKLSEYTEQHEIKNEDDLTTAPMWIHAQIPPSLDDSAIDWFPNRKDMMVEAGGGHFELKKNKGTSFVVVKYWIVFFQILTFMM